MDFVKKKQFVSIQLLLNVMPFNPFKITYCKLNNNSALLM